jgi:hypothetical protein
MTTINIGFNTRVEQDLAEYPSGPGGRYEYTFKTRREIKTRSAALFAFWYLHYSDFLNQLADEVISCRDQPIEERYEWIPSCYLDRPFVSINGKEV